MQPTRRFWGILLLGVFLILLGATLDQPVLLIGAIGLWIWAVINAVQFTSELITLRDAITVSQSALQRRVAIGDPVTITLHVDRQTDASPLPLQIDVLPPLTVSDVPDDERTVYLAPTETTADQTVSLTPNVAGTLTVKAPTLTAIDSKGLFTESVSVGNAVTLTVDPRTPRNLHIGESGMQTATAYGDHSIDQRGPGLEPIELRKYMPGDELSRIDWKATARLNEPHIREFETERSHQTLLFFDQRASLGDGRTGERKLDYLREVALAFTQSAAAAADPIGLWGIGEHGITAQYPATSTSEQYTNVQQFLETADVVTENPFTNEPQEQLQIRTRVPRTPSVSPSRTPSEARRFAAHLERDESPFATTLRPYVTANRPYVERIENRPLFAAIQSTKREMTEGTWTVLFTDDTNKAETYEAVQVIARNSTTVVVFLAPAVLFEAGGLTDIEAAHRRYQEFDSFRRKLTGITGVTAYEVGPGHRLNAVLAKQSRSNTRHPYDAR